MLTGGGGKAASKGAKKRSSYVSVDGLGYARSPPRMRTSPLGRSFAVGLAWLSGLPDVEVTSPSAPAGTRWLRTYITAQGMCKSSDVLTLREAKPEHGRQKS